MLFLQINNNIGVFEILHFVTRHGFILQNDSITYSDKGYVD